jgi:hypothetical protein
MQRAQTSDAVMACRGELRDAGNEGRVGHSERRERSDTNFAIEAQREEYRENIRTMLATLNRMAEEQVQAAGADIDGMSYEELQALGDTIGKVRVRSDILRTRACCMNPPMALNLWC